MTDDYRAKGYRSRSEMRRREMMKAAEPREFWISIYQANLENYKTEFSYSAFTDNRDNGPAFHNVHVVEYSALTEASARLEAANARLVIAKAVVEEWKAKYTEANARLEMAVNIIDGLLESHANLYEAHFGHLGLKPDDDTVRKDALEALAKIKGMG